MAQLTLVTGWFRRHGISYLDMVVGAVEKAKIRSIVDGKPPEPGTVIVDHVDQYRLASELGYDMAESGLRLEALDRVVTLLPRDDSGLSDARLEELVSDRAWGKVRTEVLRTHPRAEAPLAALRQKIRKDGSFPDMEWIGTHWKGMAGLLWHVINDAPLATQLEWYKRYSPLYRANQGRIEFATLDTRDAESPEEVTRAMHAWIEREGRSQRLLVNLWGTATAVQFGWYYLAWRMPALKDAVFLQCRDEKRARRGRFAPISVKVVQKDPISSVGKSAAEGRWQSDARSRAQGLLRFYVRQDDNFSILILGERGSGKTLAVQQAWKDAGRSPEKFVAANCANFSEPTHARSELFGHVQNAFSGALEGRDGLLKTADGGLLFLDEVHHLDEGTRSMLLTALQTDSDGNFRFRKLGAVKEDSAKFQPVFASNLGRDELTRKLMPDFLDRISQRTLEWPGIDSKERTAVWSEVWRGMKFKGSGPLHDPIEDPEFKDWLQGTALPGNFRDLERIAILVADYRRCGAGSKEERSLVRCAATLVEYLQANFRTWGLPTASEAPGQVREPEVSAGPRSITVPFDPDQSDATNVTFLAECRHQFVVAMERHFKRQKTAVEELRKRGSKMTEGTMSRWKKKTGASS